ncbi:unnamed protein product [Caenorhabditis auriculariae]|uniref:Core domain-containing protein n=1 Tax=Caenorhabditis auriculariae TaxID=2777116 RepID=A0A8S1HBN4_9PELO|nr:unnamed protein product [Caenorhabditis auriculariae]
MFVVRQARTPMTLFRKYWISAPSCSKSLATAPSSLKPLTEEEFKVTPRAVKRLKEVAEAGERLRVEVDGGGCSGFEYKIRLDKKLNADDRLWHGAEDVEIVVDEMSLGYMKGATVDFVEDLMKSSFRVVNNPVAEKGCSCGTSFARFHSMLPSLVRFSCRKTLATASSSKFLFCTQSCSSQQQNEMIFTRLRDSHRNHRRNGRERNWRWQGVMGAQMLALSWMVTIKDVLGIEKIQLDADPLKEKVKQSWLYRKRGQYNEATQVLQIALEEAEQRKEPFPITRVYDEMANTFYEMGDFEEADKYFRIVIQRLVQLHGKKDFDPEFIGVSLKLADILARKGDLESAESGFKHCVRKQMQVMEEHMKKFSVAHGALVEDRHTVDTHGPIFTDPIALFGMALEAYAHFIVDNFEEDRLPEAEEYMDEVLKISYQIYGTSSPHTVTLLNNFGAALILKHRFKLALKYLAIGIDRILYVNECAHMLPGYYCNYAEALYHNDRREEALDFAKKAVTLSRSADPRVQSYAQQYLRDLEKDLNKGRKKTWWIF